MSSSTEWDTETSSSKRCARPLSSASTKPADRHIAPSVSLDGRSSSSSSAPSGTLQRLSTKIRRSNTAAVPDSNRISSTAIRREVRLTPGIASNASKMSQRRASRVSLRRPSVPTVESSSSVSGQTQTSTDSSSTSVALRRLSISKGLPKQISSTPLVVACSPDLNPALPRHRSSFAVPVEGKALPADTPYHRQRSRSVSFLNRKLSRITVVPYNNGSSVSSHALTDGSRNDNVTDSTNSGSSSRRRHSVPAAVALCSRTDSVRTSGDQHLSVQTDLLPDAEDILFKNPPVDCAAQATMLHRGRSIPREEHQHSLASGASDGNDTHKGTRHQYGRNASEAGSPAGGFSGFLTSVQLNTSSPGRHGHVVPLSGDKEPALDLHVEDINAAAPPDFGEASHTTAKESECGGAISKRPPSPFSLRTRERCASSPLAGAAETWMLMVRDGRNSPDAASSEGLDEPFLGPARERQNCSLPAMVALAVAVLLITTATAFIFLTSSPRAALWRRRAMLFCATSDCAEHVARLGLDSTQGTDVCDDFGFFVCSGWFNNQRSPASSVVSETILQWLEAIPSQTFENGATDNDTALRRMPSQLMAACLRNDKQVSKRDAETAIQELIKSMAARGFSWPAEDLSYPAGNYSAPMQALVDLAYRWNLPLWFRLDLLPPSTYRGRKRTLFMSPSPMASLFIHLQSHLLASGIAYSTYLSFLSAKVLLQGMRIPFGPSFRSFIEGDAVDKVHSDVLRNLSTVSRARHPLPKVMKIRNLPYSLKGLEGNDWKRILQRSSGAEPPISEEDSLTVSDQQLLEAAGILFKAYSPKDVFYHTVWWLLQIMGPLVSDELFALFNANEFGRTLLKMACAVQVEATYHVLLATMSESKFARVERLSISRHLQSVRSIALERIEYAGGLEAKTKLALTSALEKTSTIIWPDKFEESSREWLVHLHDHGYNEQDQGFFSKWFSDRVRFQEALAIEERVVSAKMYRLDSTRATYYSPALQAMAVSVAALRPPFYYAQGTHAMLYAGLGYLYARQIFEALSCTAELIKGTAGENRRLGVSVAELSEAAQWESFLSCPPNVDKSSLYPELPALHVAYEAYVRFRNSSGDVPLRGLEWYSPDQLFFLTFCHATCEVDSSGRLLSQYCNDAVRNYAPFAVAFSCPSGSNMNPEDRCEYF